MELDNCITELEGEGYEVQTFIIPACAVDAKHRRERVWILANSNVNGYNKPRFQNSNCIDQGPKPEAAETIRAGNRGGNETCRSSQILSNANKHNVQGLIKGIDDKKVWEVPGKRQVGFQYRVGHWPTEPNVGRVAHGVPNRVDRLKGLGNSIVPEAVIPIMQSIKHITIAQD